MPQQYDEDLSQQITGLLRLAREGDGQAVDRIVPLLYDNLRRVARRQLGRLRPGATLDTTGLVHEAYLRLAASPQGDWQDRTHFLCAAAVAMRHILVDEARRKAALRRGGDVVRVTFTDVGSRSADGAARILDLEQAMQALAERDERLCRIVELRFYGGLTVQECAEATGLSERTVKRQWRIARAFLHHALEESASGASADAD